MKYYVADLKVFDVEKMKPFLSNCIEKQNQYLLIFSLNGVFKIDKNNNKVQQIYYKDNKMNSIQVNKINILEDSSEINYVDISQIPSEHFSQKIIEETYMMRENALLKFMILKNNDKITDFYFETEELISNPLIMEDLESFLAFKK
jgi:hypothetical protein